MTNFKAPQFSVENTQQPKTFHVKITMINGNVKEIYSDSPISCLVLPNGWFNIKYTHNGLQFRIKMNQNYIKSIEDDGYNPEIFNK